MQWELRGGDNAKTASQVEVVVACIFGRKDQEPSRPEDGAEPYLASTPAGHKIAIEVPADFGPCVVQIVVGTFVETRDDWT